MTLDPPTVVRQTTVLTPDGPFTILEQGGVVLASGWTSELAELTGQIHPTLRPTDPPREVAPAELGPIAAAVDAYYDGDITAIDSVRVQQVSGPFRSHAWDMLRTVEPGRPVTYAQYASLAGNAGAVRAAAGACAKNAAALFVPCHRVIRTDGSLGGFRWGLAVKTSLLAREASHSAAVLAR
ncbi:methylated-DNA--[protein]-cysteine S-methyltransferase [Arthrobacter sp. Bz4]|uniref:methylated-DNA--[protein]-cysteine S-methyltransferase n=1 Tax=Arthrobacter sp. Bz4 TaxID=2171979 RepID=UPI000D50C3BB|nr:methylated-DNA--[protein]-cysteine S-methyltransferase [Arthrobacter sp. Bz4]PVE17360.1 cysteine methyltransferase [Arthrobacter sp. Bz4]